MRGFLFMPSTHTKCKGRRETFARLVKSIPFPKRIVHDDQAGEEETKKRCGFEEVTDCRYMKLFMRLCGATR